MSLNESRVPARSRAEIGRMTAAMRAATAPNAPRVLRIARLVAGRIVAERVLSPRDCATVESGVRFEREGGAWVLVAPSGATGHVLLSGGRRVAIGPHETRLELDERARGKIVLGRASVLFQVAAAPPQTGTPKLPLAVTRRTVDWPLTVIAAFSFLFHFGVVGATFSDWLDPVVGDEDAAVVKLVDLGPGPLAPVETNVSERAGAHEHASASARKTASGRSTAHTQSGPATLAREAEAMKMGLLAVLAGAPAVDGAMRRSELPVVDLSKVAPEAEGAQATGGELSLHGTGVAPGGRSLASLGDGRVTTPSAGHERRVQGPKVEVAFPPPSGPEMPGPPIDIAPLRPSFRSCYVRKGLELDPTMEGKLVLDIAIAPNGDVSSVTKASGEGLSAAVETCIIQRVQNASFAAPGGSGTRVRVPVVFRRQ